MKKKTADDYYIDCLTMAIDGQLPTQIASDSNVTLSPGDVSISVLVPYLIELHRQGYIDGSVRDTSNMLLGNNSCVFLQAAITLSGRQFLEELKSKKPLARIKAKGLELLWIILTSAATAIATTLITLALAKKVSP